MSNILIVGYTAEGTTDNRFLESVIRRTFEDIAMECPNQIEIHSVIPIPARKENFIQDMVQASREANNIGVTALCIHADADVDTNQIVYQNKIRPFLAELGNLGQDLCKNIVPIVPVRMTEAWIMADLDLFKNEIGTSKTNEELTLNRDPEAFADPKANLEGAIRIANADKTQRQRNRSISLAELYQPIGQKISLARLETLSSFQDFKRNVRQAYIELNYLHD